MKKKFRYKNILFFGTLQFCGNLIEYFTEHSEKLVVYYVMPRQDTAQNMVRLFVKGELKEEKKFYSPENIFLCYILLYINFIRIIFIYFNYKEVFYIICGHPLFSFFNSFWRLFRKFRIVYFVGDYYPGNHYLNIIYRNISNFYHKRSKYRTYLSDRLNNVMNGRVINTRNIKTIMWGVNPPKSIKKKRLSNFTLGFIGVIRESQGIELLLKSLKDMPTVKLKILGSCTKDLLKKYKTLISKYQLKDRVYFPNKSFYGENLKNEIENCSAGIALYDVSTENGTHYADPAKIKTYTQFGLPVIMTNAAQVADYVKRFHAGVVVENSVESVQKGINKIKADQNYYRKGVYAFNKFFNYENYYMKKLKFLETR